jgi:predicted ABC-type transport system involved in lysophospholipase L1 biosynthesis ATPase subunit
MNQPELLLCDEPTGNLDAQSGGAVADLLFSMAAQAGVILIAVTHNLELAQRFPRQMHMLDGQLSGGAE